MLKPLTNRDKQALKAMYADCWQCPIEIGGHMDSPLCFILPKLIKRGLVERKTRKFGKTGRRSYLYALTPAGIAILKGL